MRDNPRRILSQILYHIFPFLMETHHILDKLHSQLHLVIRVSPLTYHAIVDELA